MKNQLYCRSKISIKIKDEWQKRYGSWYLFLTHLLIQLTYGNNFKSILKPSLIDTEPQRSN